MYKTKKVLRAYKDTKLYTPTNNENNSSKSHPHQNEKKYGTIWRKNFKTLTRLFLPNFSLYGESSLVSYS